MLVTEVALYDANIAIQQPEAKQGKGAAHGAKFGHSGRDGKDACSEEDLEEDDGGARPGDGAEVDAILGLLEDFLFGKWFEEVAVVDAGEVVGCDIDGIGLLFGVVGHVCGVWNAGRSCNYALFLETKVVRSEGGCEMTTANHDIHSECRARKESLSTLRRSAVGCPALEIGSGVGTMAIRTSAGISASELA